jgi:hypothetical protein
MTQYVINIGTLPNDGTGDPLRTAFNETNLNFNQVFAAGPVLSNVRITNNTILTTNTNGNLILAPNGIGVVQANVNIVPNTSNIRNLGSADRRWSTLYTQYANISGGLTLANLTATGDILVSGNLTVTGNIINVANIVTDAKTIQLANTAGTANAANGSGITVGANDAIATFLFDSATNTWDTNIGLAVNGNITGTSLAVSDATVYGNVNAINGNYTGNIVVNTVQVGTIQLNPVGGPNALSNITVVDDTVFEGNVDVDGALFVLGNVSADYFIGDGSLLTGLPAGYANANVDAHLAGSAGNIIPVGNNAQSLGNATNQWSDLWVSNATIYMNSVPITLGAGNVLTVNGEALLSNDSNTSISTTGNITADYFFGNGSQLTGLSTSSISNGTSNVAIPTASGNVTVTANSTQTWTFGTSGNLQFPDGTTYTGSEIDSPTVPTVGGTASAGETGITYLSGDLSKWAIFSESAFTVGVWTDVQVGWTVTDNNGFTDIIAGRGSFGAASFQTTVNSWPAPASGKTYVFTSPDYQPGYTNPVEITVGSNTWSFGNTGALTTPGNITTTGSITADNFFGNTEGLTGNITNLVSLNFDVENISARGEAGVNIGAGGFNNLVVLETGVLVQNVPLSVTGNVTANSFIGNGSQLTNLPITYTNLIENGNSNVDIATANGNVTVTANTATWNFGTDSVLTVPGNTVTSTLYTDNNGYRLNLEGNLNGVVTAKLALDNDSGFIRLIVGNVSTPAIWAFRDNGNLTVAGNINFDGDASAGPSLNNFASITSAANFAVTIDSADTAPTWSFETGDSALGEFDESPVLRTPAGAGSVIYNETLMAILAGNIDAGERSSVRLLEGGVLLLGTTSLDGELSTIIMEVNTGGVGIRALGDAAPRLSVTGNVTGGNILTAGSVTANGNITGGNISTAGTVSATGNLSANNISTGNVVATRVQNDGNLEIRSNVAGTIRNWTFDSLGDFNTPPAGNISVGGRLSANRITAEGNISATGNVSGGNLISSATIFGNVDVVLGNIANVSGTKTRMVTDTTFSYIQTGNGTIGSTGNIVFSPYSSPTQQVVIDTANGNLTAAGNVTAQNFIGNISITGNVTGTSANVDLVAGAYEWSFDNTGNLTLPGNTFSVNYANNTPVDIITRFEGSWNVATGNTTQSFTVDGNNTYQMWVEGNIPNGIIAWNATVTVTNTNVPVLGQQFAWNYEGGGNILMFNSIPAQIIGTAGAISNAEPAVANTNVFSFGINNASGNVQVVRYGWIKIS